jgi:hypothetical protein
MDDELDFLKAFPRDGEGLIRVWGSSHSTASSACC